MVTVHRTIVSSTEGAFVIRLADWFDVFSFDQVELLVRRIQVIGHFTEFQCHLLLD